MAAPPPSGPKPDVFQWVTLGIALWGAILGTFTVFWNLYLHHTNRACLEVRCGIRWLVSGSGKTDKKDQLAYTVTSAGRQPIVVTQLGGCYTSKEGKKQLFVLTPNLVRLPKTLANRGDYFIELFEDLSLLDENLEYLCAWDSLGKMYKASKKDIKRLQARTPDTRTG